MIPLLVFWARWFWNLALQCVKNWEDCKPHLRYSALALELTAAAPIEVAMMVWVVVTAGWWATERRCLARSDHDALQAGGECFRQTRLSVRSFLWQIGFFEPFGLLTCLAMIEEAYLSLRYHAYFKSLPWRCAVAYVSANHFLFGVHNVLDKGVTDESGPFLKRIKSFCEDELTAARHTFHEHANNSQDLDNGNTTSQLAGVGGMLKVEQQRAGFWHSLWSYNEHRLADCWVHLGMGLQSPYRVDHWVALAFHLRKYSGHTIPEKFAVPLINRSLSLDNLVDCFAHSVSGLLVLGPAYFTLAVALAELQRLLLDMDVAAHHSQDVRRCRANAY